MDKKRLKLDHDGILNWENDIGSLPCSDLKFKYVDSNLKLTEDEKDPIRSCLTCGCFGLRSEFYRPNYCVYACHRMSANQLVEKFNLQRNAPLRFFKRPALPDFNPFRKGQVLEAIDPENQSLFCVVSIANITGHRLKLHFENYDKQFDFYVNADSIDIFPPHWTQRNGLKLQPPLNEEDFEWSNLKSKFAPEENFAILNQDQSLKPQIENGMKLEAVDIRNPHNMIICVATVIQVLGERFLIHFDSWDHIYDYWVDVTCPFIYPVGYCSKNNKKITPPNNHKSIFKWEEYLKSTNSVAMPAKLFQPLPPVGFKKGMKIEAVDVRNPGLIRPGSIVQTEGHMLTVHYTGWDESYDVKFTELSGDIHPVGYCEHTGHPIELVPDVNTNTNTKCPIMNCNGKGHALKTFNSHNCIEDCPYNLNQHFYPVERVVIVEDRELNRSLVIPPGSLGSVTQTQKKLSSKDRRTKTYIQATEKKMKFLAQMILFDKSRLKVKEKFIFEKLLSKLNLEIVKNWNCNEVCHFIQTLPGCEEICNIFKDEKIDGDSLLMLNLNDIIKLGIRFGLAIKIFYAIHFINL